MKFGFDFKKTEGLMKLFNLRKEDLDRDDILDLCGEDTLNDFFDVLKVLLKNEDECLDTSEFEYASIYFDEEYYNPDGCIACFSVDVGIVYEYMVIDRGDSLYICMSSDTMFDIGTYGIEAVKKWVNENQVNGKLED